MKKFLLIIAAAAFMVACAPPKPQPVVDSLQGDVLLEEPNEEIIADQPEIPNDDPIKEEPKSNEQPTHIVKNSK
jgi:uncharacterized protein YcfL